MHGYAVGDEIPRTDAIVHRIDPDRVLIERSGRFETLPLVRPTLNVES